jgi:hypothetical protein
MIAAAVSRGAAGQTADAGPEPLVTLPDGGVVIIALPVDAGADAGSLSSFYNAPDGGPQAASGGAATPTCAPWPTCLNWVVPTCAPWPSCGPGSPGIAAQDAGSGPGVIGGDS